MASKGLLLHQATKAACYAAVDLSDQQFADGHAMYDMGSVRSARKQLAKAMASIDEYERMCSAEVAVVS